MNIIYHLDDASEYILLFRVELIRGFLFSQTLRSLQCRCDFQMNASKISIRIVVRLACERLLPGISSRTMELPEPTIVQMLYVVAGCRCARYGSGPRGFD